jgi:DNA-binding transcriptional MerR regulator
VNIINKTYNTSAIAKIIGIHPNTVRLYEKWGFITAPIRKENGYRIFTNLHIYQFMLARSALQIEVLQNGLRKKVITIIKTVAGNEYDLAQNLINDYIKQIDIEISNTYEAIDIVKELNSRTFIQNNIFLKRKDAALILGISTDTLRNWEMNGLLKVKRKSNGYRVYTNEDINKLKIIRTLRCANFSFSEILNMTNKLEENKNIDIANIFDPQYKDTDIITTCNRLVLALHTCKENAKYMNEMIEKIKIY